MKVTLARSQPSMARFASTATRSSVVASASSLCRLPASSTTLARNASLPSDLSSATASTAALGYDLATHSHFLRSGDPEGPVRQRALSRDAGRLCDQPV